MTGVIEIYWAWQNVSSLFEWLVWAAFYVLPPKLLMTTGDIGLWIKYCVAFIVIEGVAGSGGWKRGVVERSEIQWPDKFDVLHSGSEIRNKESNNFVSFSKDTSCPTSNKSNNSSIPSRSKFFLSTFRILGKLYPNSYTSQWITVFLVNLVVILS